MALKSLNIGNMVATEVVRVPELDTEEEPNAEVLVRRMTGYDQVRLMNMAIAINKLEEEQKGLMFTVAKIACCVVNDDGDYLIPDDPDKETTELLQAVLRSLPASAIGRMFNVVDRVNPPVNVDDFDKKKEKS